MTTETLSAAARELAPRLLARRAAAAEARRLPQSTISDLIALGVFRAVQPKRAGGDGLPFGAHTDAAAELGRTCGSTAWIASVIATHHWMLGKFAAAAQDDVWSRDRDALVASAFGAARCDAEPAAGGYRIAGRWQFASGVEYCQWCIVLVRFAPPPDAPPGPPPMRFMLVPRTDFRILDSWRSVGLRATGSHDIEIDGAFVPEHRTLGWVEINAVETPGTREGSGDAYRIPLLGPISFGVGAPTLGMARGALEHFCDAMGTRHGVHGRAAQHPTLQVRAAEASAEIECARLLYRDAIARIHAAASGLEPLDASGIARLERDAAYLCLLNRRAVARLAEAMGARGLQDDNPVHLAHADLQAACSHISLGWDANAQPWGRALLGLSPR